MVTVDFTKKDGWGKPALKPFEHLQLHPFTSALHYGLQCFEGLKAYRNSKGEVRLFRPWCNALRFKKSSVRLTLPDFDGNELVKLLAELVRVDERWVPPTSEYSLYVRPLHIATDETLGVSPPTSSKIVIMTGPVGPYYSSGFKPISLSSPTDTIRSAPLGTGAYKIGGYAFTYQEITHQPSSQPLKLHPNISKCFGCTETKLWRWVLPTSSSSSRINRGKSKWPLLRSRTSSFQESPGIPYW